MGWIISGSILLVLLMLPVGARAEYSEEGWWLDAVIGPVSFRVLPQKGKPKKVSPAPNTENAPKQTAAKKKSGGRLELLRMLLRAAKKMMGLAMKLIWVTRLEISFTSACADPFDAAMLYGASGAAAGALTAVISDLFHVRKMRIQTDVDFESKEPKVYAFGEAVVPVCAMIYIVIASVIHGLKGRKKRTSAAKAEGDMGKAV